MAKIILLFILFSFAASSNPYSMNVSSKVKNDTGFSCTLNNPTYDPKKEELSNLSFSINQVDELVTRILLKDSFRQRWEVPAMSEDYLKEYKPSSLRDFRETNKPFTITLYDSGKPLIKFFTNFLRYFDKFIKFDIIIPVNRVFGIGERCAHFALPPGTYTIWNRGQLNPFDDGHGGYNLYGSHPFYVSQTPDKTRFFGIFFRNSNGQDVTISETAEKGYEIVHQTVGGIIDLFVFHPGAMETVLRKYHTFIGKPYLPPFWAMGTQQSKWGYRSTTDIKRAVRDYKYYDLPIDALTLDIDYMHEYEVFTIDKERYPNFLEVVKGIQAQGVHLVLILDPGIRLKNGYHTYDIFTKGNALIRSVLYPPFAVGSAWPGACVFPDFYNKKGVELWKQSLKELYDMSHFDGLMLDMLEIENLANGEVPPSDRIPRGDEPDDCIFNPANHPVKEFDNPLYIPGNVHLETGSLSNNGYHCAHNDYEDKFLKEYNTHNLFTYNESLVTNKYYSELTGKRPFMLPRATTFGSGHYTSHWQGDNWSTWAYLRMSIPGLYSFQLFGIPHVGSDICGFGGNGNSELCARWYQVGAFYPFTRNHRMRIFMPQEPWWYSENSEDENKDLVLNTARMALRQKYALLRLYYTRMIEVHLNGGYLVGPMLFEFPDDDTAFKELEKSLMIGGAVLVSFALYPNQYAIDQYLPNADWYELKTGKRVATYNKNSKDGTRIILEASFDYINLHIKGGSIIPYQETEYTKIANAGELLKRPIELIIALNTNTNDFVKAKGVVILDDGIKIGLKEKKAYKRYEIVYEKKDTYTITFINTNKGYKEKFVNEQIQKIRIYGLDYKKSFKPPVLVFNNGSTLVLNATYDKAQGTAIIENTRTISIEDIQRIQMMENARDKCDL